MRDLEGEFSQSLTHSSMQTAVRRLLMLFGAVNKELFTFLKQFNKDILIIFFDLNCKRTFKKRLKHNK